MPEVLQALYKLQAVKKQNLPPGFNFTAKDD